MISKHWLSELPKGKESKGLFAVLGWGAFLGTSWTWVIGMILPALLIRDMGIAGFIIFALPNCIGAAAMGSILSGDRARALPARHMGMILTFSIVTVAYHFYIAGYLLPNLLGPLSLALFVVGGVMATGAVIRWKDKGAMVFSMLVWLISIGCFIASLCIPGAEAFSIFKERPLLDETYMWFFLPASIGGFLLCPYLDATFIRARARTERVAGALAFKVGFLVVFALMIVFTMAYGHELVKGFGGEQNRLKGVWATILVIHIPLQMGLTVAFHCREIYAAVEHGVKERAKKLKGIDCPQCLVLARHLLMSGLIGVVVACSLLFMGVFLLGLLLKNISFEWFKDFQVTNQIETIYQAYELERFISVGEVGYRCILIFYGTLFPAYVMLMMIPTIVPAKISRPWWLFAITVVLSSVTAYIGFVHAQGWAIGATLGVICLGRLFLEWKAYLAKNIGLLKDNEAT